MRPIPAKIRKILTNDPEMQRCIISGNPNPEWHHPFIYARKQINEVWSICPLGGYYHRGDGWNEEVRRKCEKWCLDRATDQDLAKYPKKDWVQLKIRLQ